MTCFAASYLLVLALEVSRFFFKPKEPNSKSKYRRMVIMGLTIAGLFAHTVYLALQQQIEIGSQGLWLGSWSGWILVAAWMIVVVYLWLVVRKPNSQVGIFLLPLVMVLISLGWIMQPGELQSGFSDRQAKSIWQSVHGLSLLIGTVVVAIGFVFGVMYLVKAKRLKQKKLTAGRLRLPSLEWLQLSSERSLLISTTFLASGLASGLLINLLNRRMNLAGQVGEDAVSLPWHDPIVWSSGILFIWLAAALIFNLFYSPARQVGRSLISSSPVFCSWCWS